jgi:hypothetical protein
LGGGAIADGEIRAKNASGNGPLCYTFSVSLTVYIAAAFFKIVSCSSVSVRVFVSLYQYLSGAVICRND